jgi:hypothetical protein
MEILERNFANESLTEHQHVCRQAATKLTKWPYVIRCDYPAIGLLKVEVMDRFDLDKPTICEHHANVLLAEIKRKDDPK